MNASKALSEYLWFEIVVIVFKRLLNIRFHFVVNAPAIHFGFSFDFLKAFTLVGILWSES